MPTLRERLILSLGGNIGCAPERTQTAKPQTRYTYTEGPMLFLGQQIVRAMQDQGWPSKIHCHYRPPEEQDDVFRRGRSKAQAYESPHQYLEAVDIIHAKHGWNVSEDYWTTLVAAVRMVADKFKVELEHGHHWGFRDSAHVELKDWRDFKAHVGKRYPTEGELAWRFEDTLPAVWKQYKKRH